MAVPLCLLVLCEGLCPPSVPIIHLSSTFLSVDHHLLTLVHRVLRVARPRYRRNWGQQSERKAAGPGHTPGSLQYPQRKHSRHSRSASVFAGVGWRRRWGLWENPSQPPPPGQPLALPHRPRTPRPSVAPINGDVEKPRAVQRCRSGPTQAKALLLQRE